MRKIFDACVGIIIEIGAIAAVLFLCLIISWLFTREPVPHSGTVQPRTTMGTGFSSRTSYGAGGSTPRRNPVIEEAAAVKPWSFTI